MCLRDYASNSNSLIIGASLVWVSCLMTRPEEEDPPPVVTDTCLYNPYTYIFTPIPMSVVPLLFLLCLRVVLFCHAKGAIRTGRNRWTNKHESGSIQEESSTPTEQLRSPMVRDASLLCCCRCHHTGCCCLTSFTIYTTYDSFVCFAFLFFVCFVCRSIVCFC